MLSRVLNNKALDNHQQNTLPLAVVFILTSNVEIIDELSFTLVIMP